MDSPWVSMYTPETSEDCSRVEAQPDKEAEHFLDRLAPNKLVGLLLVLAASDPQLATPRQVPAIRGPPGGNPAEVSELAFSF